MKTTRRIALLAAGLVASGFLGADLFAQKQGNGAGAGRGRTEQTAVANSNANTRTNRAALGTGRMTRGWNCPAGFGGRANRMGRGPRMGRGAGFGNPGACLMTPPVPARVTIPAALTGTLQTALQAQVDEERAAGDLYLAFADRYPGVPPFENIPNAEIIHEMALRDFARASGLTVTSGNPGTYETPEIQALYDRLISEGETSLEAALRAGAFVEERDISDLRRMRAEFAEVAELQPVLEALELGSENHLIAFVRLLERQHGETYAPQILSPSEFQAIVGR